MADQPQLRMLRPHLRGIPPLELPAPYRLACWRVGWEHHWNAIIGESFRGQPGQFDFDAIMRADRVFAPERVLFIVDGDRPVATASAWHHPVYRPEDGIIHYVGVLPECQGKRLGYHVCVAALHRMVKERRRRASLLTDDFRLAAIKTYLRLGFHPELGDPSYPERWHQIFTQLGTPELAHRYLPSSS